MRQAERRARTIEEIELMCIRLFAKQGIEHTTLDEIATRAKLTKGAIYWHYSSKEALLISVLHRSRTMWSRVIPVGIDEIDDPRERLHRLFSNYLTMFREHPDLTLFHQRVRLETKSSIRKPICEFYRQSARFIEAVLRYGEEKGIFRGLANRSFYSFHVMSALAGAHAQWLTDPELDLAGLVREIEADAVLRLTTAIPKGLFKS